MTTTSSTDYDLTVIGGGIAGLCVAEMFSRCGWRSALVEQEAQLCTGASGSHHGWFHFGSLYSIFPNSRFMRTLVGGIDDLLEYYRDFPGMNVRVDAAGKLIFPQSEQAWIRDEVIQYIVAARNDKDFRLNEFDGVGKYFRKLAFTLTWDLAIKQFISRHQRFHRFDWRSGPASAQIPKAGWRDYSRDVIFKPEAGDYRLDPDTHFRVPGFDRPMVPRNIIADLMRSFMSSGGQLLAQRMYQSYRRDAGVTIVRTSGEEITTRLLVIATGSALEQHVQSKSRVNVVASPLLVAYPAVSTLNFARLSPFVSRTINHLRHYASGKAYSVIGGGYSAPTGDSAAITRSERELVDAARSVFPALEDTTLEQTYISYKTEMGNELGERNYQYWIRPLDKDVFAVLPGKFSLGFSLAVNLYRQVVGSDPVRTIEVDPRLDVTPFVPRMAHERAVLAHLVSSDNRANVATVTAV